MRLVAHRLPLGGRSHGLIRGLGVTTGAPPRGLNRSEGVATGVRVGGSHGFLRSQGVARGRWWGVDRGWVVRTACLALLSSFSVLKTRR